MIGCDYTYSILRFRGVPYHHLLDSVRFVAADRPHTINPSAAIPTPVMSFPRLSRRSRAYPVIPVAYPVIPVAYPVIPAPIPSFPRLSSHFPCVSRHSRAYPVISPAYPVIPVAYPVIRVAIPSFPRSSRHSRAHHVIPALITSFPRRRESCGLFPKRIHRSTCATMNQTE